MRSSALLLLFSFLMISCESTSVFGVREDCTHLGETGVCKDKRLDSPPQGCWSLENGMYECNADYFLGYRMTNPSDYNELAKTCENLEQENKKLKRQLRRCQ